MRLRNERFYKILKNLPIPVCGVTLGLAAAGNMLKDYSTILHWLYLTVAAVFWAALLIKLVLCWPDAKKELINPLAFSV
ncbi:MAG: hypothetical protein II197_00340, partial [Peptococcaceae bacterium]|nr:hypothetical protein [Peptococcaceae bacterium]